MLKNAHFWRKTVKIASALGASPQTLVDLRRLGVPPPDPHVITPACYYNFLLSVSNDKCVLLQQKRTK